MCLLPVIVLYRTDQAYQQAKMRLEQASPQARYVQNRAGRVYHITLYAVHIGM